MTVAKRTFWTLVRVAIGLSLLYYVLGRNNNWTAARQLFSAAWLFPLLFAQTLCGGVIESKRLGVLFRSQGIKVPFGFGFQLSSVAAFFSLCIPGGTGGDVMKLYYLNARHRGRAIEVATVLLLDRLIAMFALLSLIVAMALVEGNLIRQHASVRALILVAGALLVAMPAFGMVACSARLRANRWYRAIFEKLPLGRQLERVSDAVYAFREHKSALFGAAGLSLVGHVLLAAMFATAGSVVMPQAPALVVCVLALLGMFANALPLTPGGIGVGESAFQALFGLTGFTGGALLLLAWRCGMASQCLMGLVFYVRGIGGRKAEPEPRSLNVTEPVEISAGRLGRDNV